jgi:hypothetical protein
MFPLLALTVHRWRRRNAAKPWLLLIVKVPWGVANFSQRSSAGQGVAGKRVSAGMNRQRLEPRGAVHLARAADPLSQRVARERLHPAAWDQRGEEGLVGAGTLATTRKQVLKWGLGSRLDVSFDPKGATTAGARQGRTVWWP